MNDEQTDAIYFREWRQFADLSPLELAKRLGLSGPQISRIETGARDYDGNYLRAFKAVINKALEQHPLRSAATQVRIKRVCDPLCIKPDPDLWLDLDPRLIELRTKYNRAVASIVRDELKRTTEDATS